MSVSGCTGEIGLNFLNEHPAQRTLLRVSPMCSLTIATSLTFRSNWWRCGRLKAPVVELVQPFTSLLQTVTKTINRQKQQSPVVSEPG